VSFHPLYHLLIHLHSRALRPHLNLVQFLHQILRLHPRILLSL
jgi:hypothetical protein